MCVTVGGETVVDLWGGAADPTTGAPWTSDTVCIVFSCTKGATALCAHVLASRGQLDLDAPVAEYWPEFARNGKEHVTVAHDARPLRRRAGVHDAGEGPAAATTGTTCATCWPTRSRSGSRARATATTCINFGWTVGELVRRVSGKSLGTFFRDEVAEPLGARVLDRPARGGRAAGRADHARTCPSRASAETRSCSDLDDRPEVDRRRCRCSTSAAGARGPNARECHAAEIGGGRRHHERARARRHVRAARRRRSAAALVDATTARAHGRGLGGDERRRHAAHPHPLRARLHEVDGQSARVRRAGGQDSTASSCVAPPSATSAPAAASASPIPRPASRSATR